MVRRMALAAICLAAAFGAPPASALMVSAEPAWNGWVQPGQSTEVAVRVVAEHGGLLKLTLVDRFITYTHSTRVEPHSAFIWRVPLSPPSGDPLQLRVQLDDEPVVEQEITFRRHLAPSPLVAVVAEQPIVLEGVDAAAIHVAGRSLPFHDSSYSAVDLVLIHREALRGMAREQLIALRQRAARCGRIIAVDFVPPAGTRLAEYAGCGGRNLLYAETGSGLGARVAHLLQSPVAQLPSPGSMRGLLSQDRMASRMAPLIVFFSIYLAVLLLAIRSRRPALHFVTASVVGSLIGLAVWTMNSERVDRAMWAEVYDGASVARTLSIIKVYGGGGEVTIDVPLSAGPVQALRPVDLRVASSFSGDSAASVSFDARLLSQLEFVASGVTRLTTPLTVEFTGEVPRVINAGNDRSPPALLAWNDRKYSVPPLTPDQDWRPATEPEPWGVNGAERLFRLRAMSENTALLLEYPRGDRQPADSDRAYLMVLP